MVKVEFKEKESTIEVGSIVSKEGEHYIVAHTFRDISLRERNYILVNLSTYEIEFVYIDLKSIEVDGFTLYNGKVLLTQEL